MHRKTAEVGRKDGIRRTVGILTSHTRTVVRECCNGDYASPWKRPKFTHVYM